jgi:hypothetical protein
LPFLLKALCFIRVLKEEGIDKQTKRTLGISMAGIIAKTGRQASSVKRNDIENMLQNDPGFSENLKKICRINNNPEHLYGENLTSLSERLFHNFLTGVKSKSLMEILEYFLKDDYITLLNEYSNLNKPKLGQQIAGLAELPPSSDDENLFYKYPALHNLINAKPSDGSASKQSFGNINTFFYHNPSSESLEGRKVHFSDVDISFNNQTVGYNNGGGK